MEQVMTVTTIDLYMQAERLLQWEYNHLTATYFVLLSRKQVRNIKIRKFQSDGYNVEILTIKIDIR